MAEIENPCFHCYQGAIGECIRCKHGGKWWSGDLGAETIEVDDDDLEQEVLTMADLIDRDAIMKKICGNECGSVCDEECENAFCNFYDYIMDAPAVNRWIPCSERLPEPLQNVIVCTDINTVTVAWLNGDHWTFADTGGGHTENWSFDAVKYWMYLPEPPEGEQK